MFWSHKSCPISYETKQALILSFITVQLVTTMEHMKVQNQILQFLMFRIR